MSQTRRVVQVLLVVLCAGSLAWTAIGLAGYLGYERGIVEPLKEDLVRRTRDAAARIETSLAPARNAADTMASRLDAMATPREPQVVDLLREAIESDPSCYGGAIAFEPHAFDPERRLYAPYMARKNGEMAFMRIEESYDYTEPEWEWYGTALAEGPRWSEPYFDASVGDILMTTYSAVFHDPATPSEARGVVTIDVSMDVIRGIVRSLDLGGMGYAVLVSGLRHPPR